MSLSEETVMSKGWNVIRFEGNKSERVWFSWEQFEAQEMAEDLNEYAPKGVSYGWERAT